MSLYDVGKFACRLFLNAGYKVEVIGKENIPDDGGVLLCCNHISNYDPPLLGSYIERPVHYMAKQELFDKPVLKWLLPKLKAFPVKRGGGDKQSLRRGLSYLKEGHMIGLFPEGTRSKTGELGKGLAGVGFFALRSNAYIVPCAIIGPYQKRQPVKLVYGKPFDMSTLRENKATAEEATTAIMGEIEQLIATHRPT
ncbi:lysophospholipid acyltransferase family protein [Shouchella shacheensis]|uniref:lysophospholipid acyltransferase family protein n=1 Tax=Shouchella shacheensis TaxID=1649580 RepID=UPI00073FFA42|nr:lysophospholipid acyltransferase family protein [Shouchella shacheensis]